MNLSLKSNDPFEGTLVDQTSGAPVYQMNTRNLIRRVTSLTKFIPDVGEFQPVAEFHWERLSFTSPYIVYRGQRIVMTDFLSKKNFFSRSRVFIAADQKQYKWKVNPSKNLVLYDDNDSENMVARTHKRHYGVFRKARDYSIEILGPGIPILDDIIVSFIIMYHLQQVRRQAASNAATASAATVC